jgi:hypothetical protein
MRAASPHPITSCPSSVGASFASVLVSLTPVVKAPVFNAATLTLLENTTAGSTVGTLTAFSREGLPILFSITSGNALAIFALGPNPPLVPALAPAGLLTLAAGVNFGPYGATTQCACGALVVNFESPAAATYVLAVTAAPVGYPALTAQAFITVVATNANDRPWFTATPMVSASETAAVAGAQLSAPPTVQDEDTPWGDYLIWSIVGVTGGAGSVDGAAPTLNTSSWPFLINNRTGQLSFARSLTYSPTDVPTVVSGYATRAFYTVQHQVVDSGNLTATASVSVAILANITSGVVGVITAFTPPAGGMDTAGDENVSLLGDFLPLSQSVYANYTAGGAAPVYSVPCSVVVPLSAVPQARKGRVERAGNEYHTANPPTHAGRHVNDLRSNSARGRRRSVLALLRWDRWTDCDSGVRNSLAGIVV